MSKSVLVIDTPETCIDCIFCQEYRTKSREYAYCYVTNGDSENDMKLIDCIYGYCQSKPDWCPLKPLPEKNKAPKVASGYELGYEDGWNKCLDEIQGGADDEFSK